MIKLVYFARLREALGCTAEDVAPPPEVTDVGTLRTWLGQRGGAWTEALASDVTVRAAVNQEMAANDTRVATGDEVAFFPPVTGG
ncbi:MAG TPA: molybdopterin converting factor subunit 1 [Burkholderiales bacterium]|jgi:molybdopterin synthase sulfur carrier subunit|nr:molybdopterin converting factor subunit 1 [Burkholderiales bacterium]